MATADTEVLGTNNHKAVNCWRVGVPDFQLQHKATVDASNQISIFDGTDQISKGRE
jgi:hypothetical protein